VRVLPVPAGRIVQALAGLDDRELLGIVGSLPRSSERRAAACELLVGRHRGLVRLCVQRYRRGPEPAEDLMQVGYVGLLKAISNFDPAFGRGLAAYAQACIAGEIKRHFRDKGWQVHVERSVQELVLQVREAARQLTQQLGHMPADPELGRYLGVSDADIRDARRAELVLRPLSLDEPLGGQSGVASLGDLLGGEDPQVEHMLGMRAVATHWGELPRREQKILLMRFHGDMTQAEIGQQLGISQMHVSRLLAHALGYLRPRLLGLPEGASGAGPAAAPGMDLTGAAHRRGALDGPSASVLVVPVRARAQYTEPRQLGAARRSRPARRPSRGAAVSQSRATGQWPLAVLADGGAGTTCIIRIRPALGTVPAMVSWTSAGPIRVFKRPGWSGNLRWLSGARLDQHERQAGDASGHALARGGVLTQAVEGPRMSRPDDAAEMTADPGACAVPLILRSQNQQAGPVGPADAGPE
jgi:RNA polymerase sigma-B factor